MIALSQALVVEGRYDKIRLDSMISGIVLTTGGFNLFRDAELQALLKRLAAECGLIVLTDSDDAGFKIRKYIADIAAGGAVYHAYIPEVPGKERRKTRAGAAGLLGVEGVASEVIEQAIRDCLRAYGLDDAQGEALPARRITAADLVEDGLSGCTGAGERRAALLRRAGLPTRLSVRAMLELLTRLYGYEGYRALVEELRQGEKGTR